MLDLNLVSQETLMTYTSTIAKWTRLSGTPEELESAKYVVSVLEGLGLKTQLIMHDAYISLPGKATLALIAPEQKSVPCITHSMGVPTPAGGVDAELVYAGAGTPAEMAAAGVVGKVALVEGRATPVFAANASEAGALGVLCISGKVPHEMCCSPVWGNPSTSTLGNLPKVHLISVSKADGEALRELCRKGKVSIHFTAEVETGWRQTPIIIGDLAPTHPEADAGEYLLYSGHLDSWYKGAMDNGTANAIMLEVARLFAQQRGQMRRSLRIAFWSGHSHGRYSGSAWYADQNWFDLNENCVAHLYTDSTGAVGATRFSAITMPETAGLGTWAVAQVTGEKLDAKRTNRSTDQSFWGMGIPALFGSLSRQADDSLGWWWHTPNDDMEMIDPANLVRDAKIFALTADRLLCDPVLPLDYTASALDIKTNLEALNQAANGKFDLSAAITEAGRLQALCSRMGLLASGASGSQVRAINACLKDLGRALIPPTYVTGSKFAHDPALDVPFLSKLQGARKLGGLDAGSNEARFLVVDLVRARNEVLYALRQTTVRVEALLAGEA
jgi:hypothetical protein